MNHFLWPGFTLHLRHFLAARIETGEEEVENGSQNRLADCSI